MKNFIRKILEKFFRKRILDILLEIDGVALNQKVVTLIPNDDRWHHFNLSFHVFGNKAELKQGNLYIDGTELIQSNQLEEVKE